MPPSQIQFQIQLEGVSTVLKNRRFKVPSYQRSYAWDVENVEALLNDISEAIRNKESEYFLGSLVVTGSKVPRFDVVDGQQRLTTVSLLIAAIKDIFIRDGDAETAQSIRAEFISSTDRKTKEKEPRLILNEVDNEVYQHLLEGIPSAEDAMFTRQSHKKLLSAARQIFSFVDKVCEKSRDAEAELHDWLDYLEANLKVIVVTAPDDSNAFVIFETLNDRGLDLAISDLLKNYLFHRSGDNIEETKNRWLSMVAVLESTTEDPLVVTYLRHFAMSKYGLIRERELFSFLKKKITSKKLAVQFSTELRDKAKTYSALINTDHEFWNAYDPQVKESVDTLNLLGMSQIRPLLVAILDIFDAKDTRQIFQKLVSVAVRFQIVGGVGGGTLERIYSDTAKSLSERKISTLKEIIDAFSTLPTDSAFEQAFAVVSISKQTLARFYLRKIEEALAKEAFKEKSTSKDTLRVNLEHVLPLTLSEEWLSQWTAEDARAYQRRIGNMTLLLAKYNSLAGNEPFSVKKEILANSELVLNHSITDCATWTKEAIDRRQRAMAKTAVKIWAV